ncbi:SAM-dependent methyltransferase [Asanoa sp. NPDC049573]|uniref:SAM-dependent methyltransferase n=1 Tax=Asanoa sp. NPDC049573 TaxID=3155396 RepID=UPI00342CA518
MTADDRPNVARMWDYHQGGDRAGPADRRLADAVTTACPELPRAAQANRAFLARVLAHLVGVGVRQFLDLGAGLPTDRNTHQMACGSRVVYVDTDPMAVLHNRIGVVGNPDVTVVQADLRDPELVLRHRDVRHYIDFRRPVAVLALAVYHFVPDAEEPATGIASIYDHVAPGSYLAISHGSADDAPDRVARVAGLYAAAGIPLRPRSRSEIAALFDRFALVGPGLVAAPCWEPSAPPPAQPRAAGWYAGLGRKTGA